MHRPDRAGSLNASLLRLQEEFELRMVEFETVEGTPSAQPGMLCVASSDEAYVQQWGSARFNRLYTEQVGRCAPDPPLIPCPQTPTTTPQVLRQ